MSSKMRQLFIDDVEQNKRVNSPLSNDKRKYSSPPISLPPTPPDSAVVIAPTPNKDALKEFKKQRNQQSNNNVDIFSSSMVTNQSSMKEQDEVEDEEASFFGEVTLSNDEEIGNKSKTMREKRLIVSPPLPPHFLNRPLPPDSPEIIYPTPNKDALNEYKKQRKQRLDQQPNNVDLLCNTETHF